MRSMRGRLVAILLVSTGAVWLCAIAWIYWSTQAQIEQVLDARLREAAGMVNSLLTDNRIEVAVAASEATELPAGFGSGVSYARQLSCQIWSLSGDLVSRSEGAPAGELSPASDGFSETVVDGERWRVYAIANEALGVRVLVGDSVAVRDRLVADMIKGLLLPAALLVPVMALLIWLSVRQGLLPLRDLARSLRQRRAEDLRPLDHAGSPTELIPPLEALNGLFRRVEAARQRERDFTTFAAHELKTPLAGLKTQAQIALASDDRTVQSAALAQIVHGVDRTGRLVRQLLDLASVEAAEPPRQVEACDLAALTRQTVEELAAKAAQQGVAIAIAADDEAGRAAGRAEVEPFFFTLALRNVLENAVLHSPLGGTVLCSLRQTEGCAAVVIEDEGPGMDPAEIGRATERFFRGRRKAASGSGLGLSIAQLALGRTGWSLTIENRGPGLRVTLSAEPSHG
ncbi:ATP-binding protein [Lutibaculum baratangense]|uniref:histidine kinase n=1 Tax=Lutibaculum baratangense AMV1 TaxID=631454 RepID=V4RW42_9HYPH|nr:ATP-binding protein [Lutibaculum baratangense]ESR27255.1 ATP binding histidine kinase [Lutibaculum baratangense AMV1]